MKKSIFLFCLVALISFIVGFALCFMLGLKVERQRGNEYRRIEELKKEVSSFFYKTMRELYEGTYNPEDDYVSQWAYESFKEYKSFIKPKCHLGKMDEAYGSFYGYAYFPPEDAFDVTMKKIDNKWKLTEFRRKNSNTFWRNLQSIKDKKQDITEN